MGDLETKVFGRLPDDTWFYPGHGKDSTLGAERAAIPEGRARRLVISLDLWVDLDPSTEHRAPRGL